MKKGKKKKSYSHIIILNVFNDIIVKPIAARRRRVWIRNKKILNPPSAPTHYLHLYTRR